MQVDHLHDVVHLIVQRELECLEDLRHHLCADVVMVIERPADLGFVVLGFGFAYIVQQGCPT